MILHNEDIAKDINSALEAIGTKGLSVEFSVPATLGYPLGAVKGWRGEYMTPIHRKFDK